MAPVISKISGYVTEVKVKDNQFVKKEILGYSG
jgi:membrane fusion protein (multidrug efflux system)